MGRKNYPAAYAKKIVPLAKPTGKKVKRDCIGIDSIERPHTFLTHDPVNNHVCPDCANKARSVRLTGMAEMPHSVLMG